MPSPEIPIPLLKSLGKSAGNIWGLALAGAAQGLSANTILDIASFLGLGVRRTIGLQVINAARLEVGVGDYLNSLAEGSRFDPNRIPYTAGTIAGQYNITMSGDLFNPFTGEVESRYITIATDTPLTVQELRDAFTLKAYEYERNATNIKFERGTKQF